MRDYVITTDNNSDLPESYYQEHGVGCTYLSYAMDGVNYTHDNFLPDHEFYDRMRNGSLPTTAQVNPENVKKLMEPYLKEGKDILHIAFSSGLSGSYNSTRIAAQDLMEEYPERKIIVVDSLAASLGQGLLVYLAQEKKEAGEDMETVAKWAQDNRDHMVHLFTVDDLDHLYRGGRVSKTTAVLGGMLNIKPVMHVDNAGKLIPIGKVRGRKKALLELVRIMDEKLGSHKDSCDTIFISHGDCQEDAQFVVDKVKEKYPIKTVVMNYVCATIGAHSGPGTVALFFVGDEK
ncbi:MAG TPA: DegV family protein [Candidatus Blautia faecigallinarum]|uniref:DegV family protein n=1 Tax=Candidatus Blautia faecigallinarum TaxID=2838488 RepID=A0A9D2IUB3_9FIRM|nr:DegV family protein [Candidatus Blautia faecigallinarum]